MLEAHEADEKVGEEELEEVQEAEEVKEEVEEVELAEVVQEVAVLLLHLVASRHLGNNADSGKATALDPVLCGVAHTGGKELVYPSLGCPYPTPA